MLLSKDRNSDQIKTTNLQKKNSWKNVYRTVEQKNIEIYKYGIHLNYLKKIEAKNAAKIEAINWSIG